METALKDHWPEYLMEAAGLGFFMLSAGLFGTLLEYPYSPVHQAIANGFLRLLLMGVAMGITAIAIIYSPWGKRSGAHINPAVTLAFFSLGKMRPWDAVFYIFFQFLGATTAVYLIWLFLGTSFSSSPVNYVATIPGEMGISVAFWLELVISFLLMFMVLMVSNNPKIDNYTGVCAGILVASYVVIAGPISGFSINPARTFASALPANIWTAFWIYLTGPVIGMMLAAQIYLLGNNTSRLKCAKLHHNNTQRCIFCGKPPDNKLTDYRTSNLNDHG